MSMQAASMADVNCAGRPDSQQERDFNQTPDKEDPFLFHSAFIFLCLFILPGLA